MTGQLPRRAHTVLASADDRGFSSLRHSGPPRAARYALGRRPRGQAPRSALGDRAPPPDRPDVVDQVVRSDEGRPDWLVPVRVGRMIASSYAALPATGITPVVCGEAVARCVEEYRQHVAALAGRPLPARSYEHLDVDRLLRTAPGTGPRREIETSARGARRRTSDRALPSAGSPAPTPTRPSATTPTRCAPSSGACCPRRPASERGEDVRVVVIGAGTGGLPLAQALHRAGVDVRVSDRDAAVSRPASTDGTSLRSPGVLPRQGRTDDAGPLGPAPGRLPTTVPPCR